MLIACYFPDYMHRQTIILLLTVVLSGCIYQLRQSKFDAKPLQRYEFTHPQMGTLFRIVLYSPDTLTAQQAAGAAFKRIDTLNSILSDYLEDSELSKLSATSGKGRAIRVSNDLWIVLEKSMNIAKQSNGAFDITVGPYVALWRRSRRQHELPTPEALAKAREKVGYHNIRLDHNNKTVQLIAPGMKLDMGGIGKGYAADEAFEVLKKYGISTALIDAGGNMVAGEAPPGKTGWEIEIAPLESGKSTAGDTLRKTIILSHAAIATSGDMYQYVEINGKRYSHIVDPRTGIGLTNQIAVTVLAPDGTTADYFSTAVSVLGLADGMKLIEKSKKTAAVIFISTNGIIERRESKKWQELSRSY